MSVTAFLSLSCLCVRACVRACVYTFVHVCIRMYVCVHAHGFGHVGVHVGECVYACVHVYVCVSSIVPCGVPCTEEQLQELQVEDNEPEPAPAKAIQIQNTVSQMFNSMLLFIAKYAIFRYYLTSSIIEPAGATTHMTASAITRSKSIIPKQCVCAQNV